MHHRAQNEDVTNNGQTQRQMYHRAHWLHLRSVLNDACVLVIVHSWLHLRSVLNGACVLVIVHSWLHLRSVLNDACVLVIVHSWLHLRSVLDDACGAQNEDVTKNGQSQGHMHH
jgi:hypothetical protein